LIVTLFMARANSYLSQSDKQFITNQWFHTGWGKTIVFCRALADHIGSAFPVIDELLASTFRLPAA